MNPLKFLIPENLDIDALIVRNRHLFNERKIKADNLYFICYALIQARAKQRKQMKQNNTFFARLCSSKLDEIVHNYSHHISFLLKTNVISTDNHFIVGEKCRGYKFNPEYSGHPLREIERDNYILRKAIRRQATINIDARKHELRGYNYLTKWLEDGKLEIDSKGAFDWIEKYTLAKIEILNNGIGLKNKEEEINQAIDTGEDFKLIIRKIKSGELYFAFAGESHRFYSVLTNLKRELRNFITYNGKSLVSVDIKNSQPYLSIALFEPEFWMDNLIKEAENRKLRLVDIDRKLYKEIRKGKKYNNIITLLNTPRIQDGIESCFQKYSDLVVDGKFYEYIQQQFQSIYGIDLGDREKVKKCVLTILFCKNSMARYHPPSQIFTELFTELHELICLIKSERHNAFPNILQRVESHLIIDKICRKIAQISPNTPLFTVHDSIITTDENQALVEAEMAEELQRWVGRKPMLKSDILEAKKLV